MKTDTINTTNVQIYTGIFVVSYHCIGDSASHFHIVCGDLNAKIGTKANLSETSLIIFESQRRNEREETHLNFLLHKNLYQMNWFFYKKLHLEKIRW